MLTWNAQVSRCQSRRICKSERELCSSSISCFCFLCKIFFSVFDETEVVGEADLVVGGCGSGEGRVEAGPAGDGVLTFEIEPSVSKFLDVQLHEDDVVPVVSPPSPSPSSLGISDSLESNAPTLRPHLPSPSSSAQEQVNDDRPPGSAAASDPDIPVPVPAGSVSVLEEENKSALDPTDPATFCSLLTFSENVVDKILTAGSNQPNASDLKWGCFPSTSNNRKFHPHWYFRKLLDGTLQRRQWLAYSETTDRVYCIDCILFGKSSQKSCHPTFTRNGFQHWKRGNGALIEHETSEAHVEASIKRGLRQLSLPLDASAKQERLSRRFQNREIVRQLADVILYLAQHCLAFRGHRESRSESFRGNFHDLVNILAKYSPVLATYLDKLNSSQKKVWNFVSWKRQNQLIQAISEFIKKKIVSEIGEAQFFSVSFDESVDSSRTEQCTCIIRYVRSDTGTVAERLVAVRDSATTTGEKLLEVLEDIFKELGLDWTNYLVGQSYDGASNMRGAYQGLQALVRDKANSALYVWCWAHRLSLAVKKAAGSCLDSAELFSNLKAVYNIINGSKNNVETYENFFKQNYPGQQMMRLKRVDTTRWMSHSFALNTVLRAFDAIIETLQYIKDHATGDSKATANGLLVYFLSEKFVLTALTYQSIYKDVEPFSTSLQGVDMDLMAAVNHVDIVLKSLSSLRSDESFADLLRRKDEFTGASQFTFTAVPPPTTARSRRKRTLDGQRAADEPFEDLLRKFKVETYFTSLDSIINLISSRFDDRVQGLFKDLSLLTKRRLTEISSRQSEFPEDAFSAFCSVYGKFVEAEDLRREILQFSKVYPAYEKAYSKLPAYLHGDDNSSEPTVTVHEEEHQYEEDWVGYDEEVEREEDELAAAVRVRANLGQKLKKEEMKNSGSLAYLLKLVHNTGLKTIFPSVYVALKIAVTLPVTSASTERSFSKLKLIKNRLRSTMKQDRLEDLMIISCERDVPVDVDKVVKIFSTYSKYLTENL